MSTVPVLKEMVALLGTMMIKMKRMVVVVVVVMKPPKSLTEPLALFRF